MKPCNYNCKHMSIRYDKQVYAYCNKYGCRLAMDGGGTAYATVKCTKKEPQIRGINNKT